MQELGVLMWGDEGESGHSGVKEHTQIGRYTGRQIRERKAEKGMQLNRNLKNSKGAVSRTPPVMTPVGGDYCTENKV